MLVIGLTGSIGMGKSATARMFLERGVPVHDADAAVHALYRGAATPLIESAFPGTTKSGVVDRALLSERVLGDPGAIRRLEGIVHPLVRSTEREFLTSAKSAGYRFAVLEIPLLFETEGHRRCDVAITCSAPAETQRARVLARPGMTQERFEQIRARQMPDGEKRQLSHFVVDTGSGFPVAERNVADILRAVTACTGRP